MAPKQQPNPCPYHVEGAHAVLEESEKRTNKVGIALAEVGQGSRKNFATVSGSSSMRSNKERITESVYCRGRRLLC